MENFEPILKYKKLKYKIDSNSEFAILQFKNTLYSLLKNKYYKKMMQ